MGATFDVPIHRVGNLLGDEGRREDVQVALAPTVCIQRFPLIGRGFEAFTEDLVLSGTLAMQYINSGRATQRRQVARRQEQDLVILITNEKPGAPFGPPGAGGVRLGGQEVRKEDQAIYDAVKLAKAVDIPILITGLSTDYEYETSDRTSLLLPRRENEMIQRVCEANLNTVVIIQAGMPIEMPWIKSVNALIYAWYGGQETGHAITDRSEVVQIYIFDLACSVQRPRKELKAFKKTWLRKGEKKTCQTTLDRYALSFWSEEYSH
ncbi:glycosyl hydrolase family 3 C-terminal domain-containing protein [Aspergillus cavernicola]|uniref:beta-glucosidase n=1 Tax=Aspergillus cavernicola TaxID=176166 RepID=A0ABR4ISS9_9EURO